MNSPANPPMQPALRLKLPATSANLGPGFDTAAVALDFYLEIEASAAPQFSIEATGRDADRTGRLDDNLILSTYMSLLGANQAPIVPLSLRMANSIPLGMGCGSSAAARLAAVALASHFGRLQWTSSRILEEAALLEGHPDNVAACWLGGFVAAACQGRQVYAAQVTPPAAWRAIVVLPEEPLSTTKARAVLPSSYTAADVVSNLQSVSLLGLAFAQGRSDLVAIAMRDRIHQPYRAPICPQLPILLPLVSSHGILGVALSGAGPAVLVIVDGDASIPSASTAIRDTLGAHRPAELLISRFVPAGACSSVEL